MADLSLPCSSIELTLLWFMELTSAPLPVTFFSKLWRLCFQGPTCSPWEPNNYGTVERAPQRGQASEAQQRGWEGQHVTTSVPGYEMSLMVSPILVSERLQCGRGHRTVGETCVLKDTQELARARVDMLFTNRMDPALSRPLPVWGS